MNDRAGGFQEGWDEHPWTGVDRRRSLRRRILKGGRTIWPNGDSCECFVRNLSDQGAQLQFFGPSPSTFDLIIDGDNSRRRGAVIWRNGNRVGVQFA